MLQCVITRGLSGLAFVENLGSDRKKFEAGEWRR